MGLPRLNYLNNVYNWSNYAITISIIIISTIFLNQLQLAYGISCFSCSSRNLTHSPCHDPFHPANVTYIQHCKIGKERHIGQFPASFCVKVKGRSGATNEELVIRTCSIENMDNQCGTFKFNRETLAGCILTCSTDGCNNSSNLKLSFWTITILPILWSLT
ncbi:uncharacterized protein LOC128387547 [Panonychus citri]|uniref:uncharacterized protein LOC128387547 n=1 Tax=Panonychus citri TaxID=50023 RepID=UPI002307C9C8|nr:uncharacterized protein LOC128387547 [Panonychus citri]